MAGIRGGFRNPLLTGVEIPDGTITTAKLDDLAVTAAKLANSSVTATKIANLAVGTAAIANAAITTAKIDDLAVTSAKISSLAADKITAGTIGAGTIILNGSSSIIQSSNFNADPELGVGWRIRGNGVAEFFGGLTVGASVGGLYSYGFVETLVGFRVDDNFLSASSVGYGFSNVGGLNDDTGMWADTTTLYLTRDGINAISITSGGTVNLNPVHSSGNEALRINIERAWSFIQSGTGASTNLIFRALAGGKALFFQHSAGGNVMTVRASDDGSSKLELDRRLTDVGNHETLRMDRDTTAGMVAVGYFSSQRSHKREIVPLESSRLWNRDWFDQLQPVKFRRRSTQGREFGFILEDLAAIGPNGEGRFLTTKGERVGFAPDEFALIAVTVDAVKDLRRRVERLELAA